MAGDFPVGDRAVDRAHRRLQRQLGRLREHLDEDVERSTDELADEAVRVLRGLTRRAGRLRARAEQTSGGVPAAGYEGISDDR